jgi:O-antigen/teichoic acid export membrane protein
MLRSRLLRGGAWLTAGNALSAGASFLRNIMIARLVSVEDFGIVVLLTLTLAVVETVSNLAVDRLLIQAPDGDDPKIQATAHALQVVRGILGGIIVFLAAASIASLFKIPHVAWAFQILALVPVIRSVMHLDTVRFQREMIYRPTFWVEALPQLVSLTLAVPLAYFLRDYSAIVWAMLAQVLTQAIVTHHLASRPYRWAWERQTVLRMLTFGWPLLANALLMFAIFQGDKAVIAVAFTTEVVGWYGAAFMLSMAPAMLVTSVMQGLLLPVLSNCQDIPEEFQKRYQQVVQACLAVGLLIAAAFAVFGPELLVALFGGSYRDGTEVVILLGLTQGVRIAKAGQFVSALALASTKLPLIANLARGGALVGAIGLVSIGYGPVAVAMTGLVGEVVSYAIGTHLLAIRVRSPAVHQLPQIGAWLMLVGLSWAIGSQLRGPAPSLPQFVLGLLWLFGATAIFVAVSHALRDGLIKFFRGEPVGGRE